MSLLTVAALGVGLAMDAVAVSLASGMAKGRLGRWDALLMAGTFGLFQCLMPLLGYALGQAASSWLDRVDHWIAFGLLTLIGGKMMWEGIRFAPHEDRRDPFSAKRLLLTGLATSIDALAVGVTLSLLDFPVLASAGLIGVITLVLCLPAVWVGAHCAGRFGNRVAAGAELFGGLVLIAIGTHTLIEHLSRA